MRVGRLTGTIAAPATSGRRAAADSVARRHRRGAGRASSTAKPRRSGDARAGARSSRARWSRSKTAPARFSRWSAATSFERSQFNRATQAMRQVGSLFKPFVYTAAIDRGYTAAVAARRLAGELRGRPEPAAVRAEELRPRVSGAWSPCATALEDSRNVPTIRLMAALGPREVVELRQAARHHRAAAGVPVGRDRRGRSHAPRDDVGVLGVLRTRACG